MKGAGLQLSSLSLARSRKSRIYRDAHLIIPNITHLKALMTDAEFESLRNVKKHSVIQVRAILADEKLNQTD